MDPVDWPPADLVGKIVEAMVKATSAMYSVAKEPVRRRLNRLRSETHARKIAKYAENIDAIKTIYQPERQVSLRRIYHPVSLTVDRAAFPPLHADDVLRASRCVLIEAIAGLGKSLLMRHLC